MGSPPRVREPLSKRIPDCSRKGITPACAGTTASCTAGGSFAKDHPRVCGNHPFCLVEPVSHPGSPPRVREPLSEIAKAIPQVGITPACAGTTLTQKTNSITLRDHPRVCGNHGSTRWDSTVPQGSPPRVREPLCIYGHDIDKVGITPACAGTTRQDNGQRRAGEDHPRVCGNHPRSRKLRPFWTGSPPRVREPQIEDLDELEADRITPACAGTTLMKTVYDFTDGDHPRVCGNHDGPGGNRTRKKGSPPRVREPPALEERHDRVPGITPACAGTTP